MSTPKEMQESLFEAVRRYRPLFGQARDLDASPVRKAFFAHPRHLYTSRFRLLGRDATVYEGSRVQDMPKAYLNEPLMYVGENGETLPCSNSEPAFILHLLHLLDVRPGHRVLEVGAGAGWLMGMMSTLVGDSGHVTGIEIERHLARQAVENLARCGARNTTVVGGDGFNGHPAQAPFDRVIFTAATWEFPQFLFEQVAGSGLVLMPLVTRLNTEYAILLRRTPHGFAAEAARVCRFVPLRREEGNARISQPDSGATGEGLAGLTAVASPLCHLGPDEWALTFGFLEFLARSDRHCWRRLLSARELSAVKSQCDALAGTDRAERSGVIGFSDGHGKTAFLIGGYVFSRDGCAEQQLQAYWDAWKSAGSPSPIDFGLEIRERGGESPPPPPRPLVEQRGGVDMYWTTARTSISAEA